MRNINAIKGDKSALSFEPAQNEPRARERQRGPDLVAAGLSQRLPVDKQVLAVPAAK